MTAATVSIEIQWLTPEQGARSAPPEGGTRYSTVARFLHQTEEQWLKEAWSVILDLRGNADANRLQRADGRFLSESAPLDWLMPGARFSLYEGHKKVADCVVVD